MGKNNLASYILPRALNQDYAIAFYYGPNKFTWSICSGIAGQQIPEGVVILTSICTLLHKPGSMPLG